MGGLMDLILNVPYSEKNSAKANGAWWNPDIKSWYVREDKSKDYYENWLYYFGKWLPEHNLLCKTLYIFQMQRKCWKCGKNTKVICLATDDAYTLFTGQVRDEHYKHLQLLSYLKYVPEALEKFLKEEYNYYLAYSSTIKDSYFINHCTHCNSVQGDNFLHEIPKEAFYKKLCYKNADSSEYFRVNHKYIIPILAQLPYYDLTAHSSQLILIHMQTEVENRASLNVTQALIDKLFECSDYLGEINFLGI